MEKTVSRLAMTMSSTIEVGSPRRSINRAREGPSTQEIPSPPKRAPKMRSRQLRKRRRENPSQDQSKEIMKVMAAKKAYSSW